MSRDSGTTFRQLQQLARTRRSNTQQVLELYAHERLIARIAASPWRAQLVLKGGMLLATLHLRDVTRDLDLLGLGVDTGDLDSVRTLIADLASIELPDGVSYDTATILIDQIRDDANYPGLRIRLLSNIHSARVRVQIDLNVGDPVAGIEHCFDPMLDGEPINVIAYPIEAVLAEKLATMMTLGDTNTRDRDFADVWLIAHALDVDAVTFRSQLDATVASRAHAVYRHSRLPSQEWVNADRPPGTASAREPASHKSRTASRPSSNSSRSSPTSSPMEIRRSLDGTTPRFVGGRRSAAPPKLPRGGWYTTSPLVCRRFMRRTGLEPVTSALSRRCSPN